MKIVSNSIHLLEVLPDTFEVHLTQDPEELLGWHDPDRFGCIVIDIDQAGGVHAPRSIRDKNPNLPIIGISAKVPHGDDGAEQRAIFIEQGGSYLLAPPTNPREILACLKRACNIKSLLHLANGRLVINTTQQVVTFDDEKLQFTRKEELIFMELARRFGALRTKENLISAITPLEEDEPEMPIIGVYVCKIRRKLNQAHPGLSRCIENVWGKGYKLVEVPDDVIVNS